VRILAIRGAGLASLVDPFEIDFDAGALRGAGLFAITGETGAGKSTLLDALCLALYAVFPRVEAGGSNEKVPDVGGEALPERSPLGILSRGRGSGFAEVDFAGRDGVVHRARWECHRARGRANGRLQTVKRALWRLDAGEAVALKGGQNDVGREIERITDLTFDQFRRTALLAQGEFDAFLRAKPAERAELLEKITGTEIYGVISRRAFEAAKSAAQRCEALRQRRAAIPAPDAQEKARRAAQRAERLDALGAAGAARARLAEALRRHDAADAAAIALARAEAGLAEAEGAYDAAAPTRRLVADLARVEPLRAVIERRDGAERARAEAATALARAKAALADAEGAAQAARGVLADRRAALAAAEAEAARLAPEIAEARTLDDAVRAAEAEAAEARRAAADAEAAAAEAEARAGAERETLAGLEREAERLALAAPDLAPVRRIATLGEALTDPIRKVGADFLPALAGARRALAEAGRARSAAAATLAAIAEDAAKDAAATADLARRRARHRETLDAILAQGPEARRAHLGRIERPLDRGREAARRRAALDARLAEAHDHLRLAAAQEADAARSHDAAEAALAEAKREAALLAPAFELAEAAESGLAHGLRAGLRPGEPCPVCGSSHHPLVESDGALRARIDDLLARRTALDVRLEGAAAAVETARDALDAARARRAAPEAEIPRLARDAAAEREAVAAAREAIAGCDAALADRLVRAEPDAAPAWSAEAEAVAAEIAQLDAAIDALARERESIEAIARRLGDFEAAATAREPARADAERALREAEVAAAAASTEIAQIENRVDSVGREIGGSLAAIGLGMADVERDAPSVLARIAREVARLERHDAAVLANDARIRDLREALGRIAAATEAARARAQERAEAAARREETAAGRRSARAALLGGEATGAAAARIEAALGTARRAHAEAEAASREANLAAALCAQADARAVADLSAAARAAAGEAQALGAALAAAGLEEATARELAAIPEAEALRRRAEADAVEAALREARAVLAERRAARAEAFAATPEPGRSALEAEAAALDAAIAEGNKEIGRLDQIEAAGREAEIEAAEIEAAIGLAEAEYDAVGAVSAAIGAADGGRFRRFAQRVTLERLADLANLQLADLCPRYRLAVVAQDLDPVLLVADADLGDTPRPTTGLSGGERFLVSLALALGLCGLEGRGGFVDTLFIDEGFGSLDAGTLDMAIEVLERLQASGRRVGVISHVEAMKERIATQIRVMRIGGGRSRVSLAGPG
jgi:exonuclease SbcC